MAIKSSSWAAKSAWLLGKDLRCEFRTRYALNAILMFALTTLTVVSFSFGASSLSPKMASSLFWLIIFFSSMSGLAQVFVKEEESRTVNVLRMVATPSIVLFGKFLFNLALLLTLEIVIVPLFLILMNVSVPSLWLFLSVLLTGSLGLASATTIIAAIISRARIKGALFAVLSFPILLPLLMTAINGTYLSLQGESFSAGWNDLRLLISYVVVTFTASVLLFDFVWSD